MPPSSQKTGTLDFIDEARAALEKEGCIYVLIIGRIGENATRTFSKNRGNLGSYIHDEIEDAFFDHMQDEFDKDDDE